MREYKLMKRGFWIQRGDVVDEKDNKVRCWYYLD